jgi:hypothetical protein
MTQEVLFLASQLRIDATYQRAISLRSKEHLSQIKSRRSGILVTLSQIRSKNWTESLWIGVYMLEFGVTDAKGLFKLLQSPRVWTPCWSARTVYEEAMSLEQKPVCCPTNRGAVQAIPPLLRIMIIIPPPRHIMSFTSEQQAIMVCVSSLEFGVGVLIMARCSLNCQKYL